MFTEDELLPISALQHVVYCERRCALVHIEQQWADNPFTLTGAHLHERVDADNATEMRGDIRVARGLRLRSLVLGISGRADVVEFHRVVDDEARSIDGKYRLTGVELAGVPGRWRPFPIDYKRGVLKQERCYEVQLCAQGLCLEEMLGAVVPDGAVYYGGSKRRLDVQFDDRLRGETRAAAGRLHELFDACATPRGTLQRKCHGCSMLETCMPEPEGGRRSAIRYLAQALRG